MILILSCVEVMKNVVCSKEKVISCHFGVKITSEGKLDAAYFCHFQLNNTNIRSFTASFLTYFVLLLV